jgi:AraC family transcriptional regulator
MKPSTLSFYQQAVQRAVDRIATHLDQALDLEHLARAAALSPFHFHRVFRGMVGETPLELHRRLRIERAAWNLLHTDTPVTSIAFQAGYETHEAFTRTFRARYDCSPSELRRNGRSSGPQCARPFQIEIAARCGLHYRADRTDHAGTHFITGVETMDVDIKDMQELRVATVRHLGPYHRISTAFSRLGEIAEASGLLEPRPTMIAIYHDDPEVTAEADLRADAAITVSPEAALPAGLSEMRIPGGRYACTRHVGPYEELGDAWARLMGQWLPQSGHRLGEGVSYEIYRNTPADTPNDELHTELYIPLA